jgi:hypothetical protein
MWLTKKINDWTTEFDLFSMHDNEGTFGTLSNFSPRNCQGLPWIKNPQLDTFYLPFEVELAGNSIDYKIDKLSGLNVNTNNTFGLVTRLIYNGHPLISITRQSETYPSVTFDGLRMKNAHTVIGYVKIATSITRLDLPERTQGAHLFLKVTRTIGSVTIVNPNH